jgi:sugar lactone lactonase YvrE
MSRSPGRAVLVLTCLLAIAAPVAAHAAVTPAGWRVDPAGEEITVPQPTPGLQGPLGAALSPDGRQLLTTSSGAARINSVDLFDLAAGGRSDDAGYDATKGQPPSRTGG